MYNIYELRFEIKKNSFYFNTVSFVKLYRKS